MTPSGPCYDLPSWHRDDEFIGGSLSEKESDRAPFRQLQDLPLHRVDFQLLHGDFSLIFSDSPKLSEKLSIPQYSLIK